jgi:hypothetical protein
MMEGVGGGEGQLEYHAFARAAACPSTERPFSQVYVKNLRTHLNVRRRWVRDGREETRNRREMTGEETIDRSVFTYSFDFCIRR